MASQECVGKKRMVYHSLSDCKILEVPECVGKKRMVYHILSDCKILEVPGVVSLEHALESIT